MMTSRTSARAPSRRAMLARISAVQQRIGASRLTEASPVESPTFCGAELPAQREPFFVHQRLDRAGVNAAPPLRERLELERHRHERFARAGGRVEDDVALLEQFQQRGLLRGVELQPGPAGELQKTPEQEIVVGGLPGAGQKIVQGGGQAQRFR